MNDLQDLMTKITQLTSDIKTKYPELYKYLDENPLTLPSEQYPSIDKEILKNYLSTLEQQLKHHIEEHEVDS